MSFDPTAFSGIVPVFPLPGAVLFPRMGLPLHIFEPRYKEMTEDALQGERLIAMALLKPGWEPHYEGRPDVFPVVGIGSILSEVRNADGTFNLMLSGVARGRIVQELNNPQPYRSARVELLRDDLTGVDAGEQAREKEKLFELLRRLAPTAHLGPDLTYGSLIDFLAAVLLGDAMERQRILEELRVVARADLLATFLQNHPDYKAFMGGRRRWDIDRPNLN